MTAVGLRVARLIIVLVAVSFFSFILLDFVPGDPVTRLAGLNATPEVQAELRAELGLDDPVLVRYGRWAGDALQGDFGRSYLTEATTGSLVRTAFPKTLELLILAQVIALAIAVPAAIQAARSPGGIVDRLSSALAFGALALPSFVLGVYLVAFFAVRLRWLPAVVTDLPGLNDDPIANLRQMLLPAVALGLNLVAVYVRLLRSELIATMQQDFVLLARARGFTERRILWRHVLRPSSLPLLTAVGLNTGGLIGGALIIENLFAIPGLGRLIVSSIFQEDLVVVQGLVLIFSAAYVMVNFAVDLLYATVDPRVRRATV